MFNCYFIFGFYFIFQVLFNKSEKDKLFDLYFANEWKSHIFEKIMNIMSEILTNKKISNNINYPLCWLLNYNSA